MNKIVEMYINNVNKELYHLVPSEDFLKDLRTNLEEYLQEFPDSSYQDLIEKFGAPSDVATEFINSFESASPKVQARKRKKIRTFIITVVAVIIFLGCLAVALLANQQSTYTDTTVVGPEIEVQTE